MAKICSITNEPVIRKPSSGPAAVTAGIREFRRACTSTTRRCGKPFAFAVRM
jgi:hypothetical protein